jgi:hypothetical protein
VVEWSVMAVLRWAKELGNLTISKIDPISELSME